MGAVRRTSEVRQAELTDSALHIIATKGIAALNTRSLAQHVGLSSGAIFRHFPSIDALLDAVVSRVEALLESTLPDASLPPVERLALFIETRSAAVGDQLGILRLVLSDQFLLALPHDGAGRLTNCVQTTRKFLQECLREGQASGELRNDLSVDALLPIVMGTVQMLALSSAKGAQRRAEASAVLHGLLTLLRPPSPAASVVKKRTSKSASTT